MGTLTGASSLAYLCDTCRSVRTEAHSVPSGTGSRGRLREGNDSHITDRSSKIGCALQGAGMDKEGFDLVHLCSTFASDPFVMAFAKLIESGARLPCQLDFNMHPFLHAPSLAQCSEAHPAS